MKKDKSGLIIWALVLLIMCGGIELVSFFITPIPLVWILSPIWETATVFLIIVIFAFIEILGSFVIDLIRSRKEKDKEKK